MSGIDRRHLIAAAGTTLVAGATAATVASGAAAQPERPGVFRPPAGPRARIIIDNDLGADPDGLFAFVHAMLCPSTDVRAVIGAHALQPTDPFDPTTTQATDAYHKAREMLDLMGLRDRVPTYAGSNTGLV